MVKKILKYTAFTFLGIIGILVLGYYSFFGVEYATGSSYVDYLKSNQETVKIGENFSFKTLDKDIPAYELILVGEIHGFKEPQSFDLSLFKHLHKKHGVRHYLAEMDIVQARLMNEYLNSKNDSLLYKALNKWAVIQGRNNKDYYAKYSALREFNQRQSGQNKFEFIGIDKIQDWRLLTSQLNNLIEKDNSIVPIEFDSKTVINEVKNRISKMLLSDSIYSNDIEFLANLERNITYVESKQNRDVVMFNNLEALKTNVDLKGKKLYGYLGLFHVMQYRVNGRHPFASMVRESDLDFADKILSINFLFVDSYNVVPSKKLPEFLRTGPVNTRMVISTDNLLFMYIWGIQDFKRSTPEFHKSLINMSAEPNPYGNTNRLNSNFQIFPVVDMFELNDPGKKYTHYSVFVRNSDWAEPFIK
ncbi:MAG: hypothetical protein ACPGEG_10180 [Salibacteraceae bacterium]